MLNTVCQLVEAKFFHLINIDFWSILSFSWCLQYKYRYLLVIKCGTSLFLRYVNNHFDFDANIAADFIIIAKLT